MTERLDLGTPEQFVDISHYSVIRIVLDFESPAIKVTVRANTGEVDTWILATPTFGIDGSTSGVSEGEIRSRLTVINQAIFNKPPTPKSLQRYLLEELSDAGFKIGTVSGVAE